MWKNDTKTGKKSNILAVFELVFHIYTDIQYTLQWWFLIFFLSMKHIVHPSLHHGCWLWATGVSPNILPWGMPMPKEVAFLILLIIILICQHDFCFFSFKWSRDTEILVFRLSRSSKSLSAGLHPDPLAELVGMYGPQCHWHAHWHHCPPTVILLLQWTQSITVCSQTARFKLESSRSRSHWPL